MTIDGIIRKIDIILNPNPIKNLFYFVYKRNYLYTPNHYAVFDAENGLVLKKFED
jgi:hypothetical protein